MMMIEFITSLDGYKKPHKVIKEDKYLTQIALNNKALINKKQLCNYLQLMSYCDQFYSDTYGVNLDDICANESIKVKGDRAKKVLNLQQAFALLEVVSQIPLYTSIESHPIKVHLVNRYCTFWRRELWNHLEVIS